VPTEEAVLALDQELDRLAAEGPTEDELRRALRRELARHHATTDSRLGRLTTLGVMAAVHRQAELVDQLPQRFAEATPARVAEAADRWLRPERSTVLHWLPGAGGEGR
jgi:predicted Zn-dependent peptidase